MIGQIHNAIITVHHTHNQIVSCYLIANGKIKNVVSSNVLIIRTKGNIHAYLLQDANGIGTNADKLLALILMPLHKELVLKLIANGLMHLKPVVISIVLKYLTPLYVV